MKFGRFVPDKPMPADPKVCRWCDVKRMDGHCPTGCPPNDAIARLECTCEECGRLHKTASVKKQAVCWQCEKADAARHEAEYAQRYEPDYLPYRIHAAARGNRLNQDRGVFKKDKGAA